MSIKSAIGELKIANIASVRIGQRTDGSGEQVYIRSSSSDDCEINITSSEGEALTFKYSLDPDDGELLVIIPDKSYIAVIDGNSFSGSVNDGSVYQSVKGSGNAIIGSHTGGAIIGNITGDIDLSSG